MSFPFYTEKGTTLPVYVRITDAGRYDQALTAIAQDTVPVFGSDFFHSLVRLLAIALEVRYAFVTECLDEKKTRARSLAFWSGERFGQNFEYETASTPCKKVLDGKICHYPNGLRGFFPEDDALAELQAESYLGAPAFDSSGNIIGNLAVMDDKFMAEDPQAAAILKIFAARAGAAIARQRIDRKLLATVTELRQLKNRLGARFELAHATYSDSVKWTAPLLRLGVTYGDLPPWNQALPIDPTAGEWHPLVLASADLFHAPPPPANSSAQTMRDMEEIVTSLNNRTCYTDFIVFKWANEQPGHWIAGIMDDLMDRYGWDAPKTARAEAILYAAMYDALLTTWHEKYRYLRPRPALLETSLPTVILTPKHPSYPAGHGTYVAAGETVLHAFFPEDERDYAYLVPEVNNARVWAGVHFRDDMLVANVIGNEAAGAVLERVHLDGLPGDRSKRVLGEPLVTSAFFGDGGPRYH